MPWVACAIDARLRWTPAHWTDIEWTCAATAPATGTGTGGIDHATLAVPAQGELTWRITARIAPDVPGSIVNQATVQPGPTQVDTNPAGNTATWSLQIVPIFADGFED